MWLTDLLRKLTKGPDVGETFRDYIGCYLYGIEPTDSGQPEYLGAPASLVQLEADLRSYLQGFLATQSGHDTPEARTVQSLLDELPQRLAAHTATGMAQPFAALPGVNIFVRKGVRQRQRDNGQFVE